MKETKREKHLKKLMEFLEENKQDLFVALLRKNNTGICYDPDTISFCINGDQVQITIKE